MKAKIFTVILLCCLCGSAWAQTIEGRVMDERSQPLEFANVEVYALPDTLLVTGTITDSLGVFTLNISELSNSVIKVSLAGYETATVVPVSGQTVVLKYKNQMLGEVSIVGERKALVTIGSRNIKMLPMISLIPIRCGIVYPNCTGAIITDVV